MNNDMERFWNRARTKWHQGRGLRILLIGAVPSLALWMMSCKPGTTSPSTEPTAARNDKALVRFINADPVGTMDILVDGTPTFSDVAYKMATSYQEIPAHVRQFELRKRGGANALAVSRRELFQGRHYSVVALPQQTRGEPAQVPPRYVSGLAILSDDLIWLEPGEAAVRLINATYNVEDLDVYLQGTDKRIGHGVDPGIAESVTTLRPATIEIRQRDHPAYEKLTGLKVQGDRLYTFIVTGVSRALDLVSVENRIER